ncbi:MAG: Enoyl-CoA hydratase/isomerase [Frankiales bacterium]|nr:Enoyl-CoA hydratase/isomerase [Frankiales bacterium]
MGAGELPAVRPADLANPRAEPVLDLAGRLTTPVRVVVLDAPVPRDVVAAAAVAAGAADGVLVGICTRQPDAALDPLVAALDLTLVPRSEGPPARELVPVADPAAAAAELVGTVRAFPHASTMLAGLLRWSGRLPTHAALDAESAAYSTLLGGPEFAGWLARRGPRPLPSPAADPVRMERSGDGLRITLDRPERRNAYGRELRDALVAALQLAELDPGISRVLLDGVGPSFCSGGDLDEFGTTPDLVTGHLVRTRAGAARPLSRLADRVEAHLHGACIGAGIELPAFAGRIVAAPGTQMRLPEIPMGLIPGAGGTVSIPRRIGRWRTLWLALSGAAIDASTALDWGLVDAVG